MSNLYELTQDYLQIMSMMEDPELDAQVLADTMEAVEGALEIKAENYAKVIRNLEGDILAIKSEVERLTNKRKALENNIRNMKEALQEAMILTDKQKFKTELFAFSIQKNAPSVIIDAESIESVPEEYLRFKEPEIDKTAIKEAIVSGANLDGIAHLETKASLRIK